MPGDRATLLEAVRDAKPGAHILLGAGMHKLSETLVVAKKLQILGRVNAQGLATAIIKHTQAVLRVASGGYVGLLGVGLWCHASDSQRRATVTVNKGGRLRAEHVQVKCISGRYSSGLQVHAGGSLLLAEAQVAGCTGSGVIVFGTGRILNSSLADNSFNGLEVCLRGWGGVDFF